MKTGSRTLVLAVAVTSLPLLACAELNKVNIGAINVAGPADPAKEVKNTTDKVAGSVKNVGDAASKAVENISAQDEVAIGQATSIKLIGSYHGLVDNITLTNYVNEVGNSVALHGKRIGRDSKGGGEARMKSRRFFFAVLDDDDMGAFSVPGNFVYVTRGLVENLGSESELAFVLGHEVGHVDLEHNLSTLKTELKTSAALGAAANELGASDVGALFQNQKFFNKVVDILADLKAKAFNKANPEEERLADLEGVRLMTAAGYDAHGAERVIDLLALNPTRARGYDDPETRKKLLAEKIAAAQAGKVGARRFDERAARTIESSKLARKDSPK